MSLELTIVMLVASWLAVATAMLWGVMRVSRRHHPHTVTQPSPKRLKLERSPKTGHAAAH
ncbi:MULTISPECIES: hypothetical protein [Pseudomonas]|uniref:Hypothetical membrane protein n=1 Tax=Pseudomonas viridiflava TaxID=33069 RepID=A0A1Y6JJZ4_PSEVI|nr:MULTISPECIES: hypothetical protein [Pseudomonas]KTC15594.1 hypothetical protein AO390_17775 [Pseudomonas marginalis ICMP 11289]MCF8981295.1 hypothetical protein [Pseudomonas syringae]VVN79744.1 hypothetical protein PS689_01012 [Pseudomonas fluorescens]MBV1810316.1 hypothetical protein [Pseudomonas viridiflava]MBV1812890.1 hypothetical protein [Pseudomonas viridiflava]